MSSEARETSPKGNRSKHTPGPWRPNGGLIETADGMALEIATCAPDDRIGSATHYEGSRLANARLIAAAPELLKALENLLGDLEGLACEFSICQEILDSSYGQVARAAIAKAKAR